MGQRRLAGPQADDVSKRPAQQQKKKSDNTVLNNTSIRRGEVFRAQRRTSENVNVRASQHVIDIPVNKIEQPPAVVGGINKAYLRGVAKLSDRLLIMLNLDKVLSNEEIQAMSSMER